MNETPRKRLRSGVPQILKLCEGYYITDAIDEADELPTARLKTLSFDNLDATDFEEFVYALMRELGFANVDWRKGTPKNASPSDRGRDIVAQRVMEGVDGYQRFETWFVDAKHYAKGVPPEALQGLMTWAESERPDVVLVASSGFLSNAAKDWIENYRKNRAPAFRVRHWEKPDLAKMLELHSELLAQHDISEDESIRTLSELSAAESEYMEKLWYHRSMSRDCFVKQGAVEPLEPGLMEQVQAARKNVVDQYGAEELAPYDDWTLGYVSGKLAAIRWALGDDEDSLDS